jgi:predicted nucleic-acid-binding Zn-ribbon protein
MNTCPKCGVTGAIEQFTRVVGYITPVSNWSKERRAEYHDRERYALDVRQKEFMALKKDNEIYSESA